MIARHAWLIEHSIGDSVAVMTTTTITVYSKCAYNVPRSVAHAKGHQIIAFRVRCRWGTIENLYITNVFACKGPMKSREILSAKVTMSEKIYSLQLDM
jgi:hypothetical protein